MSGKSKTLFYLVAMVSFMGVASFAAVPFYNWFCKVTGYGGTPTLASNNSNKILSDTIKIRFDGSKDTHLKWDFIPVQHEIEIKIGETGLAFYEAYNPTDRPIAGQASYNVVPFSAGSYFTKIDCFCFEEQVLQPGERVQMPVSFYVDPEIVNDREAKFVKSITLSYTFYEIDLPIEELTLKSNL
ncbi:MAG: cytochrome c oxidase assembly protein [Paracoccaceae bacterium]|nr:cytochrome c oxidase assembly protein [Paracoccaceae bacterium]